jgi:hypothetical protein
MQRLQNQARHRANALSLGKSAAIDAGCMALSGMAGLLAFAMAWLLLKGSGVI